MQNEKFKIIRKLRILAWRGWTIFMDVVFPRHCYVCEELLQPWEWKEGIHEACKKECFPVVGAVCAHCGLPVSRNKEYCGDCSKRIRQIPGLTRGIDWKRDFNSYIQGKALFHYKGKIKYAIYSFKYNSKQEYAYAFAQEAVLRHGEWIEKIGVDMIVPVPMYHKKLRERGYNQAMTFGKQLRNELLVKKGLDLPVIGKGVERKRATVPMKTLSKEERYNNLKNAFHVSPDVIECRKIALVVDDIYTTGATADAMAEALYKAGANKVYFFSVCIAEGY